MHLFLIKHHEIIMERVRKKNEHKPQIKLTTKRPVPVEVLEFVTCNCKKKSRCETNKCPCFSLDMKCTDLWSCESCSNTYTDQDVETTKEDDDYENVDDDDWDDMIDDEKYLLDNDDIWLGSEFLVKINFLFILKSNFALLQRYSCFI